MSLVFRDMWRGLISTLAQRRIKLNDLKINDDDDDIKTILIDS